MSVGMRDARLQAPDPGEPNGRGGRRRGPAVPAGPARRGLLPGHADARHGVPAPGVLHPDVPGPLGRDPHRPPPAGDPGRPSPAARGARPGPAVADVDADLENDLLVRAEADDLGDLKALRLGRGPAARPGAPGTGSAASRAPRRPPPPGPPRGRRPPPLRAGRPDHRHLLGGRRRPAIRLLPGRSADPPALSAARPRTGPPRPGEDGGTATAWPMASPSVGDGAWPLAALPPPVPQACPGRPGSRLGLADLPAAHGRPSRGRRPIDGAAGRGRHSRPVSFRDLWDHPDDLARAAGDGPRDRVVRVFRQEAVGEFPPLVEAWLSTPEGRPPLRGLPQPGQAGTAATRRAGLKVGSRART